MGWLEMFAFGGLQDKATDVFHKVTGTPTEDEKRGQQKLLNDQVKAYREQSELTKSEIALKRGAEVAEKRRVEEKQIRSLRRNYRGSGLMGGGVTGTTDMNNKLGG